MCFARFQDDNGSFKIIHFPDAEIPTPRIDGSSKVEGFEVKVILFKEKREDIDRSIRHMPIVHLDKTKKITISLDRLVRVVTVLNWTLVRDGYVQYYYGMEDVFFINKIKRSKEEGWSDIDETLFGFYKQDGSFREGVEIFQARVESTAQIHRTMQLNRAVTVGVAMSETVFKEIILWMGSVWVDKVANNHEFNIYADGRGRKVTIKRRVLKAILRDVAAFERCFGYVSLLKHDVPINQINLVSSAQTTAGLMVCTKVEEVTGAVVFGKMELKYDKIARMCTIHFYYQEVDVEMFGNAVVHKLSRVKDDFNERWGVRKTNRNEDGFDYFRSATIFKTNVKRKAAIAVLELDKNVVKAVFEECTGESMGENCARSVPKYVADNLCNGMGMTIAETCEHLLRAYSSKREAVNEFINMMKFNISCELTVDEMIRQSCLEVERLYWDKLSSSNI